MASGLDVKSIEQISRKATLAEVDGDYNEAFRLYISAAQSCLRLVRGEVGEASRKILTKEANRCLERAERIKAAKKDLTPLPRDPFSEVEQSYVLEKSSKVHSLYFPRWRKGADETIQNSSDRFTDPDSQPILPDSQMKIFWRRPNERLDNVTICSSSLVPDEVIQNVVTDCSVCSSIIVCIHHHLQFHSKLGFSNIYPQSDSAIPLLSISGQYILRFFFNGAYRRVLIDDQLPFDSNNRPIGVTTTSIYDIWPSLVEKAYMKLMGGYDFPGSNSSTDIFTLTGWIPEYLEISSPSFEKEKMWSRIIENHRRGLCVMTVGTGERHPSLLRLGDMQLIPAHSYAVLDIIDTDYDRRITILDAALKHSRFANSEPVEDSLSEMMEVVEIRRKNRRVTVSWDTICNMFHGVYLNWSLDLFQHKLDFHGFWRAKAERRYSESSHHFMLVDGTRTKADEEIWVVLVRHFVDKDRKNEHIALRVQQDEVKRNDVHTAQNIIAQGSYTNSSHILVRHKMVEPIGQVVVVASYDGDYEDVAFSVHVYSTSPLSWSPAVPQPLYVERIEGSFTSKNSGGNPTYPSFMNNPQYRLVVHDIVKGSSNRSDKGSTRAPVKFTVEGTRDLPLNVTVAWNNGERVDDLTTGDIVTDSGSYSYGIVQALASMAAGSYTIVVSAFTPQHRGSYSVQVESTVKIELHKIASEGDGLFCKTVRGEWISESAAGGPSFGRYNMNPMYEISLKTQTTIKVRLQLIKPSIAIPLNITIYTLGPDNNIGRQIATSGSYKESISGVVISSINLSGGRYILIPSTYDVGIQTAFQILIYSGLRDMPVSLRDPVNLYLPP